MRHIAPQTPRSTHERSTGSQASHEMRQAAFRLGDDLERGSVVVSFPVGWIIVLVRIKILLGILRINLAAQADGAVGALGGIGEYHLSTIRTQHMLAFVRGVARETELDPITFVSPDHGVGDAGVAAGGVQNRSARLE